MQGLTTWFRLEMISYDLILEDATVASFSSILRRNWSSSPRRLWLFYCRKSHFSSLGSAWYVAAMKKAGWASALVAVILLAVLLFTVSPAQAQQPTKIPWIGYLAATGSGPSPAFIQGLRDLGYVEGKNIAIVFLTAEGKSERNADLAAELVRLKVDLIVTDSSAAALALKKATSTIPIVMMTSTDPVGSGLIASFARPGGNVTGLTSIAGVIGGKHLELLKEIVPRLNRVAILMAEGPANDLFIKEAEVPARALKIELLSFVFGGPDDFEGTFRTMTKERANGLLVRLGPRGSSGYDK